jgi:hypothetical protein
VDLKSIDSLVRALRWYGDRPIDTSRPILRNPDGSIATEESATFDVDGDQVVIPTIVQGRRMPPRDALRETLAGRNPEVGVFKDPVEAEDYAVKRSKRIGALRGDK